MGRQGQLGLECLHSLPCPVTSCFAICLPFFAFWPSRGHPSPTSQPLPTNNPPLSPSREIGLPPPFGARMSAAPAVLGAPVGVGAIPPASVSLASGMVFQSALSESPLFPFFKKGSGRFVPRLDKIQQEWVMQGQIRDTRLGDRKGKHGTILGDLGHLVTSF